MNRIILFFLLLTFTYFAYPQENLSIDPFTAKIENNKLVVTDILGKQIYSHSFIRPSITAYDLDEDGVSEFMVKDSIVTGDKTFYRLFIYNAVDSFYVIDSINSGSYEPYEMASEELGGTIIVTGNAGLDSLNKNEFVFLPVNCWKVDDGNLFSVNDDIYDIFISENDAIVDFLDEYFSANIKNCNSTDAVKSAIAAGYINYLVAGEKSIASQFIKKYYLCSDIESFIVNLNNYVKTEDN